MGRKFQKGNAGGPGRPPILPKAVGLPDIDQTSFRRMLYKKLKKSREALKAEMDDVKTEALDLWLCTIAMSGIKAGDAGKLEMLLRRLIGPVKEEVDSNVSIKMIVEDYTSEDS